MQVILNTSIMYRAILAPFTMHSVMYPVDHFLQLYFQVTVIVIVIEAEINGPHGSDSSYYSPQALAAPSTQLGPYTCVIMLLQIL